MRSDLLEPGEKPELVLSGRVLNEKGIPIRNAIVYIWSANKAGEYDMVGHKYCGYQLTDEEGRYEFTTIIPGFYNPREGKHLHVKVQGISRPMTTQLYIDGEPGNEIDDYFVPELVIPWVSGPNDVKYGTFDFVIKQVVPGDNVTAESLALVQ
jgi:protocatechuate 3,4-dioxygenase beta subunit